MCMFVPMIATHLGVWNTEGSKLIKKMAKIASLHICDDPSLDLQEVQSNLVKIYMTRLSVALQRENARMIKWCRSYQYFVLENQVSCATDIM